MKLFILLTVAIVTSGLAGNCFLALSKRCKGQAAHALTPAFWFIPLSAIFFAASFLSGGVILSAAVLLPALMGGVCSAVSAFILLGSFSGSSFSAAIIIMNLNFVVPVIFSTLFLGERCAPLQIIGLVLAVIVIVAVNCRGGGKESKMSGRAALLPLAASLANGMVNSAIKLQKFYLPSSGESSFFAFEYLFAAAAALLIFAALPKSEKALMPPSDYKRCVLPALSVGVCNGVTFYTVSLIAPLLNAAAQFTIITVLSLALSLVVGFVFQGDKFTKKTAVSLIVCAAAVVCQCVYTI